ncbi:hypothetical protein LK09_01380 [Microbacterium mangrovi]|uniref:Solute-binding protein family 5 domain-containing protein n=1 Tax=Microbacterium mangrovi TaxID=1348253 RepID=A0A0B2AEB3_9MICO|nr:ABC transporter substrate-binding protein [Microbacterium mangrovi]KHK99991.1 hypothetical protein LK09_01380 [Microbacterium mangrovi]
MKKTTRIRLAAVAVLATAALALTGCHPQIGIGEGTPLVVMTPEASKPVDAITWNVFEGEPQTVDPYHSADYTPNMIVSNMCENLLSQTPDFKIKPNLASSYANPNPLTWVYDLRKDVTFWDGHPMTADDVVYSMTKNWKDQTGFYSFLYANVASITKTGPYQVTVKMKQPDYLFNEELASTVGVVVEKEFTEKAGKNFGSPSGGLMCTGPYEYGGWKQGQSITAIANAHYWNKALQPKVKKITFTFLTDDSSITSGLLSGEIDGTYNVPVSGIPTLKVSDAGKLYRGKAGLEVEFVVANQKGALRNPDIRKALQLAIDWKGIGAVVYGGEGTPTNLQMASANFGFAKQQLEALYKQVNTTDGSPQIAKAKALLKGVPAAERGKQISLVVPNQSETQQLGLAVQSAAEKIGLNFKLIIAPATGYSNYLYDPKTRGNIDLLYTQFWGGIPNPLDWLQTTAVTYGSFNQGNYSAIDDTYYQAVSTKDPTRRAELAAQMEKQLYDEMNPMIGGVELTNDVWMNKRISGAPATFDYVYYPWAAHLGGTGEK